MLKSEELKQIVDKNLEYVKGQYKTNNGEFYTTLALHLTKYDDSPVIVLCVLSSEANDKRFEVMQELGYKVGVAVKNNELKSADALFMMSEAWVSRPKITKDASKEDIEKVMNTIRPSEDPNRSECLVSVGMTNDNEVHMNMYEIKKVWTGDKVKVELKDMNDFLEKQGIGSKEEPVKAGSPLLDTFWTSFRVIMDHYDKMPENLKTLTKEFSFLKENEKRSN